MAPPSRTPLLSLLLLAGLAAPARADEVHHHVLVGDRALGLGGAFTGVADDPAAAFYNPAGLANLSNSASASLSMHRFDRRKIDRGFGSAAGRVDLSHKAQRSVPVSISLVRKIGRRDADGVRRHALGLSTFHPEHTERRFRVEAVDEMRTTRDELVVSHEDRMTWFGLSYAYRIRTDAAAGVSLFISSRRLRHNESRSLITAAAPIEGGTLLDAALRERQNAVELDAWHLVLRLGGTYRPLPDLQVGATLQPPGIAFRTTADVEERRISADLATDPPQADFFHTDQDVGASSPIPWMLRVGAAWRPVDHWLLALDVSLHGFDRKTVQVLDGLERDRVTGRRPEPGSFFPQTYRRRATANFAAGAEVIIADAVPVRFGAFTDLSAARSIDGPTDEYAFEDVERLGATLALGFRSDDWDLGVGFGGWFGWGTALGLNPATNEDPAAPDYLPVDVQDRSIFVYVTGYRHAASQIIRRVTDPITPDDAQ